MVGRKKTHVLSGNRNRSRSPARSKQASKPTSRAGKSQQTKPPPPPPPSPRTATTEEDDQTAAHQQKLLATFQAAFDSVITSANFPAILQQVKAALFKRDFATAFGTDEFLEAYAARWSPTRALCYAAVLDAIGPHLDALCPRAAAAARPDPAPALRVLALGGGAAELAAVASFLGRHPSAAMSGTVTLVDRAPWAGVVAKLRAALPPPPPPSSLLSCRLASAAVRAAAAAAPVDGAARLRAALFRQRDVFALDGDALAALVGGPHQQQQQQQPVLATLLFTLNELFTGGGVGKTTTFLLTLASALPAGSLLLVVDSPGSYAEAPLGREAKRYPMAWLLHRILQGAAEEADEDGGKWEKVESKDSVWFRLGNKLQYPIPLEDMRYQMHLYRKSARGGAEEEGAGEEEGEEERPDGA